MNCDPKAVASGLASPSAYEFGDFRVDVRQRRLLQRANGQALPLSSRAFDTLLFFLEHAGELLDKSTLMAAIWPKVVVEENNLNQHISALRRVLGERPDEHRFLVTVPGRGYRFVAPVRAVFEEMRIEAADAQPLPGSASAFPSKDAAQVPTIAPAADPAVSGASRKGVWITVAAAGLILICGLLWYGVLRSRDAAADRPTSIRVVPIRKPRLAVLPFENLSPDPNDAFFADGLHEEIISTIAERDPGIEVISRTTMMTYRSGPPKPLATVARELDASHLIEGSVRREGSKIRLTLQLIDAHTDGHIWSASYDRTLADTLTLESQVAEQVAGQLPARIIRPATEPSAPIRDTVAFDLYLKGVLALRTFEGDPDAFKHLEELFAGAIARQPDFARAYAQRAIARTVMFIASQDTSEAFVSRIRADLSTARRLAPQDPLVLGATGYLLMCENNTSGALDAFAAAETAGITQAELLIAKAQLLLRRSRIEELNATIQRMLALDPGDPMVAHMAAYHLYRAQQPVDALRAAEYLRSAYPEWYDAMRSYFLLDFSGRTAALHAYLDRYAPIDGPVWNGLSMIEYFALLRYEHRYADLRALLNRVPIASGLYFFGVDYGPVGPTPTAVLRGWTNLLLADRAAAARDGHGVLQFVQAQTRSNWNTVYLDTLTAAGYLFSGDCERARAAGRSALKGVSRDDNAVIWNTTAMSIAHVRAWCADTEGAISLLRQLSAGRPGVGPASITRDPLLTVPLGRVPAYQVLSGQLERTIRETKLE